MTHTPISAAAATPAAGFFFLLGSLFPAVFLLTSSFLGLLLSPFFLPARSSRSTSLPSTANPTRPAMVEMKVVVIVYIVGVFLAQL
ncbi:hypothetical protein E2C01_001028 [Portunus trituberculatus]|uniref:Uncharacterized protein n=1 Tax=Portunus trituberculatus TaxID=210409 RepID=A0A5B7CGK8_PORTR|nr:hypothetical protein [Portunus trituberculatus]